MFINLIIVCFVCFLFYFTRRSHELRNVHVLQNNEFNVYGSNLFKWSTNNVAWGVCVCVRLFLFRFYFEYVNDSFSNFPRS